MALGPSLCIERYIIGTLLSARCFITCPLSDTSFEAYLFICMHSFIQGIMVLFFALPVRRSWLLGNSMKGQVLSGIFSCPKSSSIVLLKGCILFGYCSIEWTDRSPALHEQHCT